MPVEGESQRRGGDAGRTAGRGETRFDRRGEAERHRARVRGADHRFAG